VRLRIADKRKDVPFFLELYEHLRQGPGVEDVVINPATGSVLLHFDADRRHTLIGSLRDSPLIEVAEVQLLGYRPRPSSAQGEGALGGMLPSPGSAENARSVLSLIVLGLTIHQLLKGHLLAPALTLLLYGADIAVGLKNKSPRGRKAPSTS
jgi:hypothetical protein